MLYEKAKKINDEKTLKFCEAVLKKYEEFDINGNIDWSID
jgi:hypothetical protein